MTIRAGDVHRDMGLTNAMPAVCSAIGSKKFLELAGASLIERAGPANGANVYFTFALDGRTTSHADGPDRPVNMMTKPATKASNDLDLTNAVVLVSCVKSKLSHPAPARELYTSAWFTKVRTIVEASGARWFILSAFHGLVAPGTEIAPYERTLKNLPVPDRRAWASTVIGQLLPALSVHRRVVLFAGARYREFLIDPLRQRDIEVVIPMEGLALGEQLAWLSDHG